MTQPEEKTAANIFKEKLKKQEESQHQPEFKWFRLVSDSQFYELLYFHGKSAPITIGDTLIFEQGRSLSTSNKFNKVLALQSKRKA